MINKFIVEFVLTLQNKFIFAKADVSGYIQSRGFKYILR